MHIEVRPIRAADPEQLQQAFSGTPWARGVPFFAALLVRHAAAERAVFVGESHGICAAFGTLLWNSDYPPFRELGIPEVSDLNVHPGFRRRGFASAILDAAETLAFERSDQVGIAFGLHPGYRAAQRLYVLRGYVPDGRGLYCNGRFPKEGEQIALDDGPLFHLTKQRKSTPSEL